MVGQEKGRGLMRRPFPVMEVIQLAKELGCKEKCMDSRSLAKPGNYPLTRKNSRFDLLTLSGYLWGQISNVDDRGMPSYRRERQESFSQEVWISYWIWRSFSLVDKFRIIAADLESG
jgi:hypothetical protein